MSRSRTCSDVATCKIQSSANEHFFFFDSTDSKVAIRLEFYIVSKWIYFDLSWKRFPLHMSKLDVMVGIGQIPKIS